MNSPPTTSSSQLLFTPDARPKRAAVSEEPVKKLKKPNSEIRKQQNRIASRNYRTSICRSSIVVTTTNDIRYRREAQTEAPVPPAVDQGRLRGPPGVRTFARAARSVPALSVRRLRHCRPEFITIPDVVKPCLRRKQRSCKRSHTGCYRRVPRSTSPRS